MRNLVYHCPLQVKRSAMTTGLVIGIIGILVIVLVVAPLISRARQIASTPDARATQHNHSRERAGVTATKSASRPPPPPSAVRDTFVEVEEESATLNAARVEGRVKASSVKKVGEIVGKHPDEALAVVRSWMNKDR